MNNFFKHPFVVNASPSTVLLNMIDEARGIADFSVQEIQVSLALKLFL